MSLPKDRDARNALPIWEGVIAYFPDVWAEVAKVSVAGNKQHNLGSAKLYWNTHVSTDHENKVFRHMLDDLSGEVLDTDGTFHLAKALWRIAAALQIRIWKRDGKDEHGQPIPIMEQIGAQVLEAAFARGDAVAEPIAAGAPRAAQEAIEELREHGPSREGAVVEVKGRFGTTVAPAGFDLGALPMPGHP